MDWAHQVRADVYPYGRHRAQPLGGRAASPTSISSWFLVCIWLFRGDLAPEGQAGWHTLPSGPASGGFSGLPYSPSDGPSSPRNASTRLANDASAWAPLCHVNTHTWPCRGGCDKLLAQRKQTSLAK
jgi:hypothetical protein